MKPADHAALDADIRAVCPIDGVRVGDDNDRATWVCQFKAAATSPQRTAAQNVINTFDMSPAASAQREKESQIDGIPAQVKKWIHDVDNRVRVLEGQPTRTPAQLKSYVSGL